MKDELYHELRSEICLTRAMLFLGMTSTTYELCEHPLNKILSAVNAVIAVLYLACFYVEKRRAGE